MLLPAIDLASSRHRQGSLQTSITPKAEGLLRIPCRLQSAIETFLGDYSTHDLKISASRLSEALRNSKFALQKLEEQHRSLDEDDQGLWQKWQKKIAFRGQLFNRYRERDTCAYVAARMPAVYSAVYRVLSEVSRRLPYFKPQHVFDYGAGPGTAMWAVCETWPNTIELANLIEPSEAMSFARRRLFQGMKDSLPEMRNFNNMDAFNRQVRPTDRDHNLVIASYSLGELKSEAERISVARQLWGLTTDLLVIVEPGTPRGSTIVREIRSHILCMENKRLWRHQKKKKVPVQEESSVAANPGAFVVAPCPHDGVCPLDGTDKYCHFSQRLERSSSQLLVKRPKGKSLRGYEDEKFSYIVLRRGTRPRIDWPLDRVDPRAFETIKVKTVPHTYDVIIEEPVTSGKKGHEENPTKDSMETESEGLGEANASESTTDDEHDGNDTTAGESTTDDDYDDGDEDTDSVADMGSGWGRIIFQPMRRGRRVVVDVCCSANKIGSQGMFDRKTLTRATNKVLHFQARRSRWGDLWPCGNIR